MKDEKEIAFPSALNRNALDGSMESLHEVDRYLTYLHDHRDQIRWEDAPFTLLRASAYLGEVIPHAAPDGEFSWVDYDDYMPSHPELRELIPERKATTWALHKIRVKKSLAQKVGRLHKKSQ